MLVPASTSLFESPHRPQHVATFDAIGSFPVFGSKMDLSENVDTSRKMDDMATRQATLVVPREEPEREQELPLGHEKETHLGTGIKKPDVHVIKRRNVGVPKFLRFLFQILEVENPAIITWSHEGTAFQIIQPDELAHQILPKYFKHNKVSSFQRQLNYFGFKKWTKTQTNICTFSHPYFFRADKDRMKLIKRKERVNAALASAGTIKSNPMEMMTPMQLQQESDDQFETHDLVQARSHLPTQQALKRQKSSMLSGATVTFLNSASAGRRHSTGMLPGSEAFGLAAAAAAAINSPDTAESFLSGHKLTETLAEQEFALEMETRSDPTTATSMPQQYMHMRKLAATKDLSQRYSYLPAHGKRQSLPHVGIGEASSMGMNITGAETSSLGPRGMGILGRRRSDQFLSDYNQFGNTGPKLISISQVDELMASTSTSTSMSQQTMFTSNTRSGTSVVLPLSSTSTPEAYQLQQQQQFSSGTSGYGTKSLSSSGWSMPIKSEWPTSVNASSSSTCSPFQSQPRHQSMMPFKFGNMHPNPPNLTALSIQTNAMCSIDFPSTTSDGNRKVPQRPLLQQFQSQPERGVSSQQEQTSEQDQDKHQATQQPRDYIDVLLESAGLDENLAPPSSTMLSSESWHANEEMDVQNSGSSSPDPFGFMHSAPHQLEMESISRTSTPRF
ncbi:hypothetical protein PsorP6_015109 [Peronosclerospora sorghi]|uniref:Uncharacterized protein n=1 Tax=Peronosclerospora sorghi TaxID=230839 RepID=A0ACC0VT62_9STRA|nr:hypothetical protein PsorP6_015109 [Peronosclerospora sorghi]